MNPTQQLRLLGLVWGRKALVPGQDRYVGLGYMDPEKPLYTRSGQRRFNGQKSFIWPKEKESIRQFLATYAQSDLYFTPSQFRSEGRSKDSAEAERCLWADLDKADPRKGVLRRWEPTVAWETSPGSFQAVWVLQDFDASRKLSDSGGLNQRLNYAVGADKGGWASNKYLRVPGSLNHKPERVEANGGKPYRGKVLWHNRREWLTDEFNDLPAISTQDLEAIDHATEDVIDAVNRMEVWSRVRLKLNRRVREFMAVKTEEEAVAIASSQGEGRSGIAWEIERELADAGCNAVEIVAIIRPSVWNKFAGRSNEITQLLTEASKAIGQKTEQLEEADTPIDTGIDWVYDLQRKKRERPRWIVRDIWMEGACGFISGVPKSYKSFIATDLITSLSTGQPFLGEFRVPRAVPTLIIEEEDNESLLMDRYDRILEGKAPTWNANGYLRKHGKRVVWFPPEHVPPIAVQVHKGFLAGDSRWHDWLDRVVEEHGFKFVLIDTMGTTQGDVEDKGSSINSRILRPLKQISQKHGTAIGIIHHNRKAQASGDNVRHGQEMLGATAFHAWVESALYFYDKQDKLGKPSRVFIHRECKMDTELRFSVDIPYMDNDQNMTFAPVVNRALTDDVSREQEEMREVEQKPRKSNSFLLSRMRRLGATNGRLKTLFEIAESLQVSEQDALRQLKTAVSNGDLMGSPSTGWTLQK